MKEARVLVIFSDAGRGKRQKRDLKEISHLGFYYSPCLAFDSNW